MAAAWYGGDLFVVRPVRGLRGVTERLAAGDLSVRGGPDYAVGELGLLAHSFDQMADSLPREREEDLRRAKDELEQRVQARTAELSAVNEHLSREIEDRQLAQKQVESIGRLYRLLSRVNETIGARPRTGMALPPGLPDYDGGRRFPALLDWPGGLGSRRGQGGGAIRLR